MLLALHAMATRFELLLPGEESAGLRAAGEEALREIERLEDRLSLFRAGSEIADLNARAWREPVQVTPELFALLEWAQRLHAESLGAFDITVAPLVRCWGFMGGTGRVPEPKELEAVRSRVGMHLVELDSAHRTARFAREGVMLDLGAIGKGYAVDRAVEVLREAGVTSALLHGGTSTVYGLGHPPAAEAWTIGIEAPQSHAAAGEERRASAGSFSESIRKDQGTHRTTRTDRGGSASPLTRVCLRDEAVSVSAVWGKCFESEGQILGHVLDPRLGRPVSGANLAAVVLPSATETDALSTALLVRGEAGMEAIGGLRAGMSVLVATEANNRFQIKGKGAFPRQLDIEKEGRRV